MAVQPLKRLLLQHVRQMLAGEVSDALADRDLVARLAEADDAQSVQVLMRRHGPLVWSVCRRHLADFHEAEDAFQATFLLLLRKAPTLRVAESVGPWLYGVAYRVARRAAARWRRNTPAGPMAEDRTEDPRQTIHCRELAALLEEELHRLPEKLRAPLVLCYLQGLTRDEAATQLGCPWRRVKLRLEQGRELLRQRLVRRGVELTVVLAAAELTQTAVPAALTATTLQALQSPAAVTAGAALLVQETLKMMLVRKLTRAAALLFAVAFLATAAAVGVLARAGADADALAAPPADPAPPAAAVDQAPPPRVDQFGDPLPVGAFARLGTARLRHAGPVSSVVFAPDGKVLASAGGDGTVRLWEVASGKPLHTCAGHTGGISVVSFAPDGKVLASAGEDGTVRLWEAASGKTLNTCAGHKGGVTAVSFAPDGKVLASAGYDGTVRLWEAASGKQLYTCRGHTRTVHSVSFAPDGKVLASTWQGAGVGRV